MKKWLLIAAAVIIAALASVYIFIPAQLNIVQITPISCTTNGAYRVLSNTDKWRGWWPGAQLNSNTFHFNGGSFSLTKQLNNTLEVLIQQKELHLASSLHLIPAPGDSTIMNWSCNVSTGANPITRIQKYQQALALKKNMHSALTHFKTFAEKKENIYGISFNVTVFRDSFMVSVKSAQKDYPDVSTVYSQLNAIKQYSASHQAKQTAPPIMNVTPLYPAGYQLLTAVPVDRQVPASGRFFNQRIPLNRFWVTRARGGSASVEHAMHQFQLYVQDYQKTVMALPFQKLITDRSAEPDTSRWITDIYFPLF